MNSKRTPIGLLISALVFFTGCGYRLTPFLTPVYKNPPGYSETYKKQLLGDPHEKAIAREIPLNYGIHQKQSTYLPPLNNAREAEKVFDSESQNSPVDASDSIAR